MAFNSHEFVFLFFPVLLIGYYLVNQFEKSRLSNLFLLLMSIVFYCLFEVKFILVILISVFINYICGSIIHRQEKHHKILMIIGISVNVLMLLYFKYLNFFIENINMMFGSDFSIFHLILPIGISFFSFQQIAYIIDVYRNPKIHYPFLEYALHVIFFPYILSGPIVRHNEIIPQLCDKELKKFNSESFAKGLMAFIFGLFKKVIIADTLANLVTLGYGDIASLNTVTAAFVMVAYTFQIYFDFSGYSDMVVGIGAMLNIKMPVNFNSPYKAISIPDFWKRWHMSLTRFFTDYIYIPLGGNRKGVFRTYINIFVVFLVSGFWHGANWTFILWGILHGLGSTITRLFQKPYNHIPLIIKWGFTFLFVNIAWVLFRSPSISDAISFISRLFSFNFSLPPFEMTSAILLPELKELMTIFFPTNLALSFLIMAFVIMVGLLLSCVFMKNTLERVKNFKPTNRTVILCVLLFVWSVISFSNVATFIYQNF